MFIWCLSAGLHLCLIDLWWKLPLNSSISVTSGHLRPFEALLAIIFVLMFLIREQDHKDWNFFDLFSCCGFMQISLYRLEQSIKAFHSLYFFFFVFLLLIRVFPLLILLFCLLLLSSSSFSSPNIIFMIGPIDLWYCYLLNYQSKTSRITHDIQSRISASVCVHSVRAIRMPLERKMS